MSLINTSVDDMRSSLKCNQSAYTIDELQSELTKEVSGQNRKTVIALLKAAIKRKIKNKKQ
jgi:hypothetical protein